MEDASANVQVRKLKSLLKRAEEKVLNHDKVNIYHNRQVIDIEAFLLM